MDLTLRDATPADAAGIVAIYAPIVRDTAISFELTPPDEAEIATRIRQTQQRLPWLVAEDSAGRIAGYVYASRWRERAAYQWAVEVTAYVHADWRGQGVARRLYGALFERLVAAGYRQAVAGITLPNAASVGLHEAMGFVAVARFPAIGHKHGAWRDVGYWQKALVGATEDTPRPPVPCGG